MTFGWSWRLQEKAETTEQKIVLIDDYLGQKKTMTRVRVFPRPEKSNWKQGEGCNPVRRVLLIFYQKLFSRACLQGFTPSLSLSLSLSQIHSSLSVHVDSYLHTWMRTQQVCVRACVCTRASPSSCRPVWCSKSFLRVATKLSRPRIGNTQTNKQNKQTKYRVRRATRTIELI